ncbi:MAG: type II secretion system protein GspN [Deltaproteobacteria bacterium]|nr:type II secretion system protein GspN [Deltaproteobacteria bacterium]
MRKLARYSLALLALGVVLLGLLLAALFLVNPGRYSAYLEQSMVRSARDAGVLLSFGNSQLSLSQLQAHQVKIAIPRKFLFFDVDSISLQPEYLTLLGLKPRMSLEAKLYEGTLNGIGQYWLRSGEGTGSIRAQDIKVAEHAQLSGLGLRDGTLALEGLDLSFDPSGLRSGKLQVLLQGVQKPQTSSFPLRSFGLPLDLQLPSFSDLNLSLRADVQRPNIEISEFDLSSSLGTLKARGKLTLAPNGQPGSIILDGTTELTSEGLAALGQYLPLLSGGSIDETTSRFRFLLKGSPQLPSLRLTRF